MRATVLGGDVLHHDARKEFAQLDHLREIGFEATDAEMAELFLALDVDGSKSLASKELVSALARPLRTRSSAASAACATTRTMQDS